MGANKKVKAVRACDAITYFRNKAYDAWVNIGGATSELKYPTGIIKSIAYKISIHGFCLSKTEAHLRFIEPVSIHFDSYGDSLKYEMIPLIWDCWPRFDDRVCRWLKLHRIKSCIFTCQQSAERIQKRLPYLNILVITEGIDIVNYGGGKLLNERRIDVYTYGRFPQSLQSKLDKVFNTENGGNFQEFKERMQNSKITIVLPRCDVEHEVTGGQETLTQRYWECMLSRMVMVGRCPKELIKLVGYNPVISIDYEHIEEQLNAIIANIEDYQELVNKNRETALRMASWEIRMKQVMEWLESLGYTV